MLAENLENMIKRERSKGHRKGVKETLQKTLRKQIRLKFGDLPEWAAARLEKADAQKLEAWTEGILPANSLEELLGQQ